MESLQANRYKLPSTKIDLRHFYWQSHKQSSPMTIVIKCLIMYHQWLYSPNDWRLVLTLVEISASRLGLLLLTLAEISASRLGLLTRLRICTTEKAFNEKWPGFHWPATKKKPKVKTLQRNRRAIDSIIRRIASASRIGVGSEAEGVPRAEAWPRRLARLGD